MNRSLILRYVAGALLAAGPVLAWYLPRLLITPPTTPEEYRAWIDRELARAGLPSLDELVRLV